MAKEICISSTPHETRLAILEDDQLAEIYYERENEYTLAGSIYNGRVTRVLPGMQSAFVDLGLERDAFLYVTDFLELEDQEETDELEKAAASGGNQAPREVRHANGAERTEKNGRNEDRPARNGQRHEPAAQDRPAAQERSVSPERPTQDRTNQDRPERQGRDRRPVEVVPEAAHETFAAPGSPSAANDTDVTEEGTGGPGAKRWRGRRRRRGGKGAAAPIADPVETEASAEVYLEPSPEIEVEIASEIQAEAAPERAHRGERGDRGSRGGRTPREEREPRGERSSSAEPEPFVLPGESLSKYGGTPAEEAPPSAAQPEAPVRSAATFKPSTLIEVPLEWDGSGLLPGESLSKHRRHEEASAAVDAEPQGVFADAADALRQEKVAEVETFAKQTFGLAPEQAAEVAVEEAGSVEDAPVEGEAYKPGFDEASSDEPDEYVVKPMIEEPSAEEPIAAPTTTHDAAIGESASDVLDTDASASHNVDPLPPSGFRLFGLGGKKKKGDEDSDDSNADHAAADIAVKLPGAGTVSTVSGYAPGSGLVEEELIEEEEFEAPRHAHRADEGDFEDFEEEEKLHTQIRSGELGEMLQEAHLDHRIQLNFDDKANAEASEYVVEEDEDDEPAAEAEGQPASGDGQAQQRRERGGRGRRGRGNSGGQQNGGTNNRRGGGPSRRSAQTSDLPIISDLLKPGQEILVQIAKEPIAKKGARITSHIALPGRFLVFMPTVTHVGVSRKIASDEERQRLKRILTSERGDAPGGFIVRTAAEGASEEELRADLRFLIHLWDEIKQRSETSKSPALIYHDLSLIERILRDQVSSNFSSIWVDSEADYERIVRFLNRFSPTLVRRVKLYTKETPLFEQFGIQDEISKALRSKVWLKSGGSIVINQTEALVAIDINTGKYVGKSARLEDTIVKTNLDAVPEIVRQIRLRDLGGIIIIDFIDMDERKNRFKVMAALEEALKNDRAPTKVLQFNDFGLVAITRKRVKQSLERTLSVPCPICQATGMVKSPTTVCNEIYTELRKMRKHFEGEDVLLRVHPETVKVLKSNNARWLTEFEELAGKNVLVKSDATLHPEQFDIQG